MSINERTFGRRKFISGGLSLAGAGLLFGLGCKPEQPSSAKDSPYSGSEYEFIDQKTKDQLLSLFGETFSFPILPLDSDQKINLQMFNEEQQVSFRRMGIDSITLSENPQSKKLNLKLDLNDNAELGSKYDPLSGIAGTPIPSYVFIWNTISTQKQIGELRGTSIFQLIYDESRKIDGINIEFPLQPTPGERYVFILNSRIIKIDGKETPLFTFPFQIQFEKMPDVPTNKT